MASTIGRLSVGNISYANMKMHGPHVVEESPVAGIPKQPEDIVLSQVEVAEEQPEVKKEDDVESADSAITMSKKVKGKKTLS
jgi:hypothetical protein